MEDDLGRDRNFVNELETLAARLLPQVRSITAHEGRYRPHECLGVYLQPHTETLSYELPGLLVGQFGMAPYGQTVTLLDGIPKKVPPGAVLVGSWDYLSLLFPDILSPETKPSNDEGYYLWMQRYCIIAGASFSGCLYGAQTMIQLISQTQDDLPALSIADAPAMPVRSIACNLRDMVPDSDSILKTVGLLNSFKGNRLHLILNPLAPVSPRPGFGTFEEDDARELALCSREYGISIIPWIDLMEQENGVRIPVENAAALCSRVASSFTPTDIGVGGLASALRPNEEIRAVLKQIDQNLPREIGLYLHKRISSVCPDFSSGRRIMFWEDADLKTTPGTAMPFCLSVGSGAQGFVGLAAEDVARRIDRIYIRHQPPTREITFRLFDQTGGRLWEHDIISAMVSASMGWSVKDGALDALKRFTHLAFGNNAEGFLELQKMVSDAIPTTIREHMPLQEMAFGFPERDNCWQLLERIDWGNFSRQSILIRKQMADLRQHSTRNADLIEFADISIDATQFLRDRYRLLTKAAGFYNQATKGTALAAEKAGECLDTLSIRANELMRRLASINKQQGICRREVIRLQDYHKELTKSARELRGLNLPANDPAWPAPSYFFLPEEN